MSQTAQAKVLRALEERQIRRVGGDQEIAIDVRLVTATHQDLQALQDQGQFRQDLYFRLNVFVIELPPCARVATISCFWPITSCFSTPPNWAKISVASIPRLNRC